jgi:ribose-phosphate pyrophosphokinase
VCASHGLFSGSAVEKILKAQISEVVVTDSVPQKEFAKLKVLSVADLIGEAIKRTHENKSISCLFE